MITLKKHRLVLLTVIFIAQFLNGCNKIERPEKDIDRPVAYVVNGESNSLSILDLGTGEQSGAYEFRKGSWPHHIYPSSTGDRLLVSLTGADLSGGHAGHADADESWLMVLRSTDLKVLNCVRLESIAHNAIFMKDDNEIWVPQDGEVLRLEAKSLKEKETIAVGAGPLEITTDQSGAYVFVANGEGNSITVIDAANATVVKTIMVGEEPVGAWPASNNKMYVDCEVSQEVFEIDVATLAITDTIDLGFTPAYVVYCSSLSQLWISDAGNGGIHNYQLIGDDWTEIGFLATGLNAHAMAINKDQSRAYVTNQFANTVSVIDVGSFTKISDITVGQKPNGILLLE